MKRALLIIGPFCAVLMASACSSTQDVLEPSAVAASPPAPGALGGVQAISNGSGSVSAGLNPGIARSTRIRVDPLVGPTAEAAAPFSQRLSERARSRGIELVAGNTSAETHVLKGYFSVLSEDAATTVIYVWDVYDTAGNRLHRINGQQKAPASRRDSWAAVPAGTMQSIADSTIDQLVTWLASGTG